MSRRVSDEEFSQFVLGAWGERPPGRDSRAGLELWLDRERRPLRRRREGLHTCDPDTGGCTDSPLPGDIRLDGLVRLGGRTYES